MRDVLALKVWTGLAVPRRRGETCPRAAIDDLFSRTDVETITAYISDGETKHPAAWQPSLDSGRGRGHGRSGEPMTVYTLARDWLRQRL